MAINIWMSAAVAAALASAFAPGADADRARPGSAAGAAAVVEHTTPGAESLVGPASASSYSIDGPSSVRPNTQCSWWAIGTYGASYEWTGGHYPYNAGDHYIASSGTSTFQIRVTVYDGFGQVLGTASKNVTVSANALPCMT